MYKEFRNQQSTPDMWATNFQGGFEAPGFVRRARYRLDKRWKEIAKRLRPPATVVDAGCGLGEWGAFLDRKGFKVLGLDYSADLIRPLTRKYRRVRWICGTLQQIPLASNSAAAVISWGVIEHDEAGPCAALREFYRVVAPGGYIFVTVPFDTPTQRLSSEVQFGRGDGCDGFFQYFFSGSELGRVVRDTGFDLEMIVPCGSHYALLFPRLYLRVMRWPSIVQRAAAFSLAPILWLNSDSQSMLLAVGRKPR